ncbi:D-methionine transport system permease protein [Actinoplanes octamycinicus]|uniref:D-methionine transport system permease protein n=1 Tax=Actinoplanes octamycinicus TaxID=135948 RepID=A0A7W7H602_9ACTN|nr:methionine ABC transporter permease [Actinoplanes octamycinicus]MBB4744658.1 D-methionine transport system permease protein [Actinoplanes octamycinicus]GIE55239.1 metal ABC transporter permease [Actinoplanes octamycinicus]
MTWSEVFELLGPATTETLYMVGVSALFTAIGGLLIGVLFVLTEPGGLLPARPVNALLGLIVNLGRSIPFLILMVSITPFTRLVAGVSIGTDAAIVPLVVGAIPFFARIVETALHEVPGDVVAAATAIGAGRGAIVGKVLLREALPALISGFTITIIALTGYTAMAGTVGGGGIGAFAIDYGYNRFEGKAMLAAVVILLIFVQLIQMAGDLLARRLSHR